MKKLFQFLSELNGSRKKMFQPIRGSIFNDLNQSTPNHYLRNTSHKASISKSLCDAPHSLVREHGLIVLPCQFLLLYILPVLRWIPLLQEGREPHSVITRLNTLYPTIQSPIAGEEIGKGALHWIERCTLLVDLALTLLCVPTEGASKCPTHSIPKLLFLTMR